MINVWVPPGRGDGELVRCVGKVPVSYHDHAGSTRANLTTWGSLFDVWDRPDDGVMTATSQGVSKVIHSSA